MLARTLLSNKITHLLHFVPSLFGQRIVFAVANSTSEKLANLLDFEILADPIKAGALPQKEAKLGLEWLKLFMLLVVLAC